MSEPQRQLDFERLSELTRRAELWQRRYRMLLDSLPDAVFLQDESGNIVSVNTRAEALTGYGHDDLLRLNVRDLLGPECAERAAEGEEFSAAVELRTQDESRQEVTIRTKVVSLPEEPLLVQYLVSEAADKPAGDDGHAETRFRLMAKNLTEMVLAYDMDRRLTFANAAAETLTGYSLSELEKEPFVCWVHAEDRGRMLEQWNQLFDSRSVYEEEYRLVTKDGRVKWVAGSWGPIVDDHGAQVGVQGRQRDVTERRMAEETLRQSEQGLRVNEARYRTLFEESPFPLWEEDFSRVKIYLDMLQGLGAGDLREYFKAHPEDLEECVRRVKVLDINRAARDFYGARDLAQEQKDELLGNLTAIFDETAYEVFSEELATLAANQSLFKAEFQTRTLTGEARSVSMIVSLAPTPNHDWSRAIVSFFDITDRKQLEEQVMQSQKLESLGRLAGGIAHDFNNLLTVITGYADLLLHGLTPPEEPVRRGLSEILNASKRGAELTQQLLSFSRKQVVQLRPLNLNDVVREAEGMLKRVIGEDVELAIELDPIGATVKGDRGQMHQVLMNLVINGREAMPNGGRLTIETRHLKPYLLLRVSDTGVGMDAETKRHIFKPFFTTKHRKGTGLGLATVFSIVTQSGGHVSVESETGLGSAFSVYLPHVSGLARPEGARVRPVVSKGTGAVLVVEDQAEVRTLTCMIVRNLGYEVLEAADGQEALAVAERHGLPIRLLISDVIMPGLSGPDMAAQLALTQPQMKMIFMSGYTDRIINDAGELDRSIVFLQKPFTPDKLGAAVHRVLG